MPNPIKQLAHMFSEMSRQENHRRAMMSPEEETAYNRWLTDQAFAPRIGATIPCPLDLEQIDARTARPSTPLPV